MHYGQISLIAFAAGAVLFLSSHLLGYGYSSTAGGNGAWNEENAARYHDSASRLHALSHSQAGHDHAHHSHQPENEITPAGHTDELALARAEFEKQQQELQSARGRGQGLTAVFRWLGILSIVGGGIGYITWKNTANKE